MLICLAGCAGAPPADPLKGWTSSISQDPKDYNAITPDFRDYMAHQDAEPYHVTAPEFFEDGAGRHAVRVEIFEKSKNSSWTHVLIYDKENRRTNVVKYHVKYMS
jgi:hypothetical protein